MYNAKAVHVVHPLGNLLSCPQQGPLHKHTMIKFKVTNTKAESYILVQAVIYRYTVYSKVSSVYCNHRYPYVQRSYNTKVKDGSVVLPQDPRTSTNVSDE